MTGRLYHVLALPRDAQGRKLKSKRGRGAARADYYRLVRPASGFNATDMNREGEKSVRVSSKIAVIRCWLQDLGSSSIRSACCLCAETKHACLNSQPIPLNMKPLPCRVFKEIHLRQGEQQPEGQLERGAQE